MFEVNVKNVTEGREGKGRGGDQLGFGVLMKCNAERCNQWD